MSLIVFARSIIAKAVQIGELLFPDDWSWCFFSFSLYSTWLLNFLVVLQHNQAGYQAVTLSTLSYYVILECCPINIYNSASTGMAVFDPALRDCPASALLICSVSVVGNTNPTTITINEATTVCGSAVRISIFSGCHGPIRRNNSCYYDVQTEWPNLANDGKQPRNFCYLNCL
jgi:hypothetical protein